MAAALRRHYPKLKSVFRAYARPHAIPLGSFTAFCGDVGVARPGTQHNQEGVENAEPAALGEAVPAARALGAKALNSAQISKLFMSVNYAHMSASVRGKRNPDRAFTRCQFIDSLVHLGLAVMPKQRRGAGAAGVDMEKALGDTVDAFVKTLVLPYAQAWDGTAFRESMYTREVDEVMRAHEWTLSTAFAEFSPSKGNMDLADFSRMLGDANLLTFDFTTRDAQRVFVMSQQTIVDEMQGLKFAELECVEFLEAVVRVADEAVVYSTAAVTAHAKGKGKLRSAMLKLAAVRAFTSGVQVGASAAPPQAVSAGDSASGGEPSLEEEAKAYRALPLHAKLARLLQRLRKVVQARAGWNASHCEKTPRLVSSEQ